MSTIVTRAGKGAPLTHSEVDANFTNLNADKYQAGANPSFGNITVTGTVDGRDVAADGAKLDGIEAGATADQTAAEILTAIKTVDGTGSGLDADTLDGQHASAFLTGNQTITLSGDVSGSGTTSIVVTVADDSHNHIIANVDGLQTALDGKLSNAYLNTRGIGDANNADNAGLNAHYLVSGAVNDPAGTDHALLTMAYSDAWSVQMAGDWRTNDWYVRNQASSAWGSWAKLWHDGNDGSGSGLDADTLDGQHASAFLTGNQTITLSGDLSGSGTTSINAQLAANVVGANELNVVGNGTTAQYLRSDGDGTFTWATPPDTNTTYTAGSGLTLAGTVFSHTDTSAQASVNNSGNAVIQDVTLDTYGHVTGLVSATIIAPTTNGTSGQTLISNGTATPTWGDAAAGATGGGSDKIFWENDQTVTTNYTITAGKNAGSFGPITIASGVTVTVGSGDTWTVV